MCLARSEARAKTSAQRYRRNSWTTNRQSCVALTAFVSLGLEFQKNKVGSSPDGDRHRGIRNTGVAERSTLPISIHALALPFIRRCGQEATMLTKGLDFANPLLASRNFIICRISSSSSSSFSFLSSLLLPPLYPSQHARTKQVSTLLHKNKIVS
jgi:hypothetical protein